MLRNLQPAWQKTFWTRLPTLPLNANKHSPFSLMSAKSLKYSGHWHFYECRNNCTVTQIHITTHSSSEHRWFTCRFRSDLLWNNAADAFKVSREWLWIINQMVPFVSEHRGGIGQMFREIMWRGLECNWSYSSWASWENMSALCQNVDLARRCSHCSHANSIRLQQTTSLFHVSFIQSLFLRIHMGRLVWNVWLVKHCLQKSKRCTVSLIWVECGDRNNNSSLEHLLQDTLQKQQLVL